MEKFPEVETGLCKVCVYSSEGELVAQLRKGTAEYLEDGLWLTVSGVTLEQFTADCKDKFRLEL